jgi:hypothetical protein
LRRKAFLKLLELQFKTRVESHQRSPNKNGLMTVRKVFFFFIFLTQTMLNAQAAFRVAAMTDRTVDYEPRQIRNSQKDGGRKMLGWLR